MFNEQIRYLTEIGTGVLTLPFMAKQYRYQDSGIYVCSVSNGVPDSKGIYYNQDGHTLFRTVFYLIIPQTIFFFITLEISVARFKSLKRFQLHKYETTSATSSLHFSKVNKASFPDVFDKSVQ